LGAALAVAQFGSIGLSDGAMAAWAAAALRAGREQVGRVSDSGVVLVVRGTKKLRDRVKGAIAHDPTPSTTALGDWFATALFWRPQVAMLVNEATLLPVFLPLAPAATLLDRAPVAIAGALRRHGLDDTIVDAELHEMRQVQLAATNNRSVLGVMNEYAFLGELQWQAGGLDLDDLSMRMAQVPLRPLRGRGDVAHDALRTALANTTAPAEAPTPRQARTKAELYQLKITLVGTRPPVWRRVLVHGSIRLDELHRVIQAAFGWWDYHLHEFVIGRRIYGSPDPDEDWGPPVLNERHARLDKHATEGDSFTYVYDMGDNWQHTITVEKTLPSNPTQRTPALLDGRRACPPEDCGGTGGYEELLAVLADPTHPDHQQHLDWLGAPFDPERFDPAGFSDALNIHATP
jgi:hypothetical protein